MRRMVICFTCGLGLAAACATSDEDDLNQRFPGSGGLGGFSGSGGSAGDGATAGSAGAVASGGTAGEAGAAGSAGSAGSAGNAGQGGSAGGGAGGSAGSAGSSGNAGAGGSAGSVGGSAGSSSGGSGGAMGSVPSVALVLPGDLAEGVAPGSNVRITFSEPMSALSLTTNTTDSTCSGSVQVSSDNFATCVQMSSLAISNGDRTATVQPAAALDSMASYAVRVTTAATSQASVTLAAPFDSTFQVRYYHTITIDGVNDFTSDEMFAASSTGYSGYVAWDDTFVYLAMKGADVASNSAVRWVVAYLGGPAGTTTGQSYASQSPNLPFSARYHLRWKADNSYTNAQQWLASGSAWTELGWDFTGDVFQGGDFIEMRVPLADIGSPTQLALHLNMVEESPGWTYGSVPSTSVTDGSDPDYTRYYDFHLGTSQFPATYAPQ